MAPGEVTIGGGCGECGVEIRTGSQFCYNCGQPVGANSPVQNLDTKLTDVSGKLNDSDRSPQVIALRESDRVGLNGSFGERTRDTITAAPGQPLKKRKRPVRPKRGPVDVVWQKDDGPTTGYLVVAIGFAVLAAVLLAAAYYLK